MTRYLTIIMYHYVRDLKHSRFPRIKALDLEDFLGQLDFLSRHYTFVKADEVIGLIKGEQQDFPPNGLVLSFDDGYLDHWTVVFPRLYERGIQGFFFPPVKPILTRQMMEVNKIQFILASVQEIEPIIDRIMQSLEECRQEFDLGDKQFYWKRYARASRMERQEVIFVKRMLQVGLPRALRTRIIDELFSKYVTADEPSFASELYLTVAQLREMQDCGMYIGSHGNEHFRMTQLTPQEQELEICASLGFLELIGAPTQDWIMCYPHGATDNNFIEVLIRHNCAMGLTTEVGLAEIQKADPFRLPRLDTIDLPYADVPRDKSKWTKKVFLQKN